MGLDDGVRHVMMALYALMTAYGNVLSGCRCLSNTREHAELTNVAGQMLHLQENVLKYNLHVRPPW